MDVFLRTKKTLNPIELSTLEEQIDNIKVIVVEGYELDSNNEIKGQLDPNLLKLAKKYQKPVMLVLANQDYSKKHVKKLLKDDASYTSVIEKIITYGNLLQRNGVKCYGVQFDFRNIRLSDQKRYIAFIEQASSLLHQYQFKINVSIIAVTDSNLYSDAYNQWMYKNVQSGYGYYNLSRRVDSVSLVVHPQHTAKTPPGAIASFSWVDKCIKHAIKNHLDAEKIILEIPTYSMHWYPNVINNQPMYCAMKLSYHETKQISKEKQIDKEWDNQAQCYKMIAPNYDINSYFYLEENRAFKEKLSLIEKYNLKGCGIYQLGFEDPEIWLTLKTKQLNIPNLRQKIADMVVISFSAKMTFTAMMRYLIPKPVIRGRQEADELVKTLNIIDEMSKAIGGIIISHQDMPPLNELRSLAAWVKHKPNNTWLIYEQKKLFNQTNLEFSMFEYQRKMLWLNEYGFNINTIAYPDNQLGRQPLLPIITGASLSCEEFLLQIKAELPFYELIKSRQVNLVKFNNNKPGNELAQAISQLRQHTYEGIFCSYDLAQSKIETYLDFKDIVVKAIKTGFDLLWFSSDEFLKPLQPFVTDLTQTFIQVVEEAIEDKTLIANDIHQAHRRAMQLKRRYVD